MVLTTDTNIVLIRLIIGFSVGSGEGFYNKVDYTFESGDDVTFVVHEFGKRGFVNLGNTVVGLAPPADVAGGFSDVYAINESNQVAGYGTTLYSTPFFVIFRLLRSHVIY